jgi:hypothetical protein
MYNNGNSSKVNKQQLNKAWVNFNGTGVVAIRDSFNVSSITDNSAGNYDINFSSDMSNNYYTFSAGLDRNSSADGRTVMFRNAFVGSLTIMTSYVSATSGATTPQDMSTLAIQITGD